jgi:hypothetical protein
MIVMDDHGRPAAVAIAAVMVHVNDGRSAVTITVVMVHMDDRRTAVAAAIAVVMDHDDRRRSVIGSMVTASRRQKGGQRGESRRQRPPSRTFETSQFHEEILPHC